ncbi:hypothetical protein CFRS1_v001076 [Colletotrichum fructicola]|nr:hypothetical protein CFRS1_v001076 [Colletotrichum fructicola]
MSSSSARFYLTLAFQIIWRLVVRVFDGFRGRWRPILRAVGLGIVAFIGEDKPEPPKVLISQSRAVAVSRCAIHILPTAVSLFLISFNLQGYFIGSELQGNKNQDDVKSGVLQLAAKIQELLIVSSLGTIIFHVLREELIFGDGLPLGLVVSGWQFTQLSYFWSADFWGAIFCPSSEPRSYIKRLALLALIGISGLIAVMAGPAAAVLMLPAQRDFDIGGGVYWANGGDAELWPKVLDAEYYSSWNCSSLQNQLEQHQCPAAGFSTLHSHYLANTARPRTHVDYQITTGLISKSIYVQPSAAYMSDTWAFTAHGPSARVHDLMRFLHLRSLDFLDRRQARTPLGLTNLKFSSKQRYTLETQIPAARTVLRSRQEA